MNFETAISYISARQHLKIKFKKDQSDPMEGKLV